MSAFWYRKKQKPGGNIVRVGATRAGKSEAAARYAVEWPGALVVLDPHRDSLAQKVLRHVKGNVLYERLSDTEHTLGWDFLSPSTQSDPDKRRMENDHRARCFVDILMREQGGPSLASTPLKREWVLAAVHLRLAQRKHLPLTILPFAFRPGTKEFDALVQGCEIDELRWKFEKLRDMTFRTLRSECGSAVRVLDEVCSSPAFALRARGGFPFEAFMASGGKLIVERGDDISDAAMRAVMGAIILKTITYAKSRPNANPPILLDIDEANNAGLVGEHEANAMAETQKFGLSIALSVQVPDFGPNEAKIMQNARHEWYRCVNVDVARRAAQDVCLLTSHDSESSDAEHLRKIQKEIMTFSPGWRYVRNQHGASKEYVPMLQEKWSWNRLADRRFKQKIEQILARPEYGRPVTPASSSSAGIIRPPSAKLLSDSSPASRLRRDTKPRPDALPSLSEEASSTSSAPFSCEATDDPKSSTADGDQK